MNIKKLLLASLSSFAIMFVLGGLWYAGLMAEFYKNSFATFGSLARVEPIFLILALEVFVVALAIAWLYPQLKTDSSYLKSGLILGVVVGFLVAFPGQLAQFAVGNGVQLKGVFVDTLFRMFEQGIGGLVVAWIYNK